MAKRKLTLSVDDDVVERAHEYSRDHGMSISRLVNDFLARLTAGGGGAAGDIGPIVQELTGILPADVDAAEHRRHLEEKHG